MQNFRIFTESKADIKFIKDYIHAIFNIELNSEDFDALNGWSGYKSNGKLKASIIENTLNQKQNILILDADENFAERKAEVLADFYNFSTPIDLFLFPNNNNIGNLEDLLAEIAVDTTLMACFLEYEKCVKAYPKKLNDSRIYSYLDMLLLENSKDEKGYDLKKEEFRNYQNKAHWYLQHEYLIPLETFLKKYFPKSKMESLFSHSSKSRF